MNQPIELPLEKQLELRTFRDAVERMDLDQAKTFLIELHYQMLCRETLYRQLLKQQIGLDTTPQT